MELSILRFVIFSKENIIVNNYPFNKFNINILNSKFQDKIDFYILYKLNIILKDFISYYIIIKLAII